MHDKITENLCEDRARHWTFTPGKERHHNTKEIHSRKRRRKDTNLPT